jgi:hypothetical protein
MNSDKSSDNFIETLKKKLPTDEQRMNMIVTLLGSSGHLLEFLISNYGVKNLPTEMKYCCSLIAANMLALTSDNECKVEDKSYDFKMDEQAQERIYRIFKEIVFMLYDSIKEEEKGI